MPKVGMSLRTNQPEVTIIPTPEQQAIWDMAMNPDGPHMVINACAGSGKTTTGVELCKKLDSSLRVAFVAFNTHIAKELQMHLRAYPHVLACTYHSLGLRMIRSHFYGTDVEVDKDKVETILSAMKWPGMTDSKARYVTGKVRRLVSLAKQYGAWDRHELEKLVDYHDMDLNGVEEDGMRAVPVVMRPCLKQTDTVDYDDMIWMPKELAIKSTPFDLMLIDEAQDTGLSQQWLALNGAKRLIVIGDRNQSIYSFRGADSQSIPRMAKVLGATKRGVVEMPLTLTRRCPKSHVKLAQRIVP